MSETLKFIPSEEKQHNGKHADNSQHTPFGNRQMHFDLPSVEEMGRINRMNRRSSQEQVAGIRVAGIDSGSLAEAMYWQAFHEKFDLKFTLVRLETKIYQKTKLGLSTEAEEAEWRRLKLWEFTLESIFKAVEPEVCRQIGKRQDANRFLGVAAMITTGQQDKKGLARTVGLNQK